MPSRNRCRARRRRSRRRRHWANRAFVRVEVGELREILKGLEVVVLDAIAVRVHAPELPQRQRMTRARGVFRGPARPRACRPHYTRACRRGPHPSARDTSSSARAAAAAGRRRGRKPRPTRGATGWRRRRGVGPTWTSCSVGLSRHPSLGWPPARSPLRNLTRMAIRGRLAPPRGRNAPLPDGPAASPGEIRAHPSSRHPRSALRPVCRNNFRDLPAQHVPRNGPCGESNRQVDGRRKFGAAPKHQVLQCLTANG